jgi:hypothetical protein
MGRPRMARMIPGFRGPIRMDRLSTPGLARAARARRPFVIVSDPFLLLDQVNQVTTLSVHYS